MRGHCVFTYIQSFIHEIPTKGAASWNVPSQHVVARYWPYLVVAVTGT